MSEWLYVAIILADLLWFIGCGFYRRLGDHIAEELAFGLNYLWEPWYHHSEA